MGAQPQSRRLPGGGCRAHLRPRTERSDWASNGRGGRSPGIAKRSAATLLREVAQATVGGTRAPLVPQEKGGSAGSLCDPPFRVPREAGWPRLRGDPPQGAARRAQPDPAPLQARQGRKPKPGKERSDPGRGASERCEVFFFCDQIIIFMRQSNLGWIPNVGTGDHPRCKRR